MWPSISTSSLSWVKFCDAHSKMAMVEVTEEQLGAARILFHSR